MDVLKICGIAMLCVSAIWVLRQWRAEMTFPVRAVGTVLIFGMVLAAAQPVFEMISAVSQESLSVAHSEILISGLGISLVCTLGAGICRDFGETGLAAAVESAGKIAMLLKALPLITEILGMTKELLL